MAGYGWEGWHRRWAAPNQTAADVSSASAYDEAAADLDLTACVPSLKPFLNRLGMCLKCLHLPVPVVLRRIAFTDQLYLRIFADG
mmetsp:Transcript_3692/g.9307  ORF Transcript_3692/g.9307 Transcript_3692/m.9307 type:complete len:85 (-) Transcript_3692:186-440(-)|eukprot:CAMPEP_0198234832 /NCGR_PEP_ID=MMETSP1446-20131203/721_1 /TAXON_ID=1461542 ORGANISM="Unidentified sp, Strain CCMP2111" /NCGR_SAMPLE_ID=MMETSP1446 /ASSEMBLY_ACC=CAM_ASM_001112 /LENGTH=84 /DNA_ID=CAMNT_0043915655 /DNA_START=240 /DNA_END=494 /DNA_ORIENTATION=+